MIDWILEILKESGAVGNNNETIVKIWTAEGRKFFARFDYYFHMRCFFWNPHRGIGFLDSFICAENVYWWISCQDPAKVSVYFVDSDHNFFLDYKNGYE